MIRARNHQSFNDTRIPDWLKSYAAPLLAGLLALAAYLRTIAPTVFPLDSAELAAAAAGLGLVHSPGYPVHLLIAHLFTLLPIGDVAYRVNLLSAVATAGTVFLLVLLLKRKTGQWVPATAAGLSFSFSFYAWSLSVAAEVYTLQALLLSAILLALWHWRQHSSGNALALACLLMGLACANNPATLLWWPGLFILAWTGWPGALTRSLLVKSLVALAIGLAVILYLPIRSAAQPAFNYVGFVDQSALFHALDLTRPANLIWYLSGGPFAGLMFSYSWSELLHEALRFGYWLWAAFLGLGIPLGVWGIWGSWRQSRQMTLGLLVTLAPHTCFFGAYRVVDKETLFLPVFLIWAIFLGLGLQQLIRLLPRSWAPFAFLIPVALLAVNLPYVDVSDLRSPQSDAEIRLRTAEPGAVYLARWGEAAAMEYLQIVEELRPDVVVINAFLISPSAQQSLVSERLITGQPIYMTYVDSALEDSSSFVPIQKGYRLEKQEAPP